MKNSTTQAEFFQKLDTKKYYKYENNLSGIASIFLVLKELWWKTTESEVFERAFQTNSFNPVLWWNYKKLISIFEYFFSEENIEFKSIELLEWKLFHNRKLKKEFSSFENKIYIASLKLDENHLVIIDKVDYNNLYYTSVGTKEFDPVSNRIIKFDDFKNVYNKRGILIKL